MPSEDIRIVRWPDLARDPAIAEGLTRVFFVSSATQSFASDAAREEFRQRWLGCYLEHFPQWAYVALDGNGRVAGYLVGSLEDPVRSALFSDIGYFKALAGQTRAYPAQLHVNVDPGFRGQGIGAGLVEAFCSDAAAAGAPGVHVVTARGMRNAGFYAARGFAEVAAVDWNGKTLVMLGRTLAG